MGNTEVVLIQDLQPQEAFSSWKAAIRTHMFTRRISKLIYDKRFDKVIIINLMPRMSLDLRKFILSIIWVHAFYFFSTWSTQNLIKHEISLWKLCTIDHNLYMIYKQDLNDFHKLINTTATRKNRLRES